MEIKITGADMRRFAEDIEKQVTKTATDEIQKRTDSVARRYAGKPKDEVRRALVREMPGIDKDGANTIAEEISKGNRVKFRSKP